MKESVTREIIERTLLAEMSMDSAHLKQYQDDLRTVFVALPKNEHGFMEPAAVRYALHRYFVSKHGRYVKGLEPAGQSWHTSASGRVTKSRVPAYIQSLFEKRLQGRGMSLYDLAVFAATLSDFVNNEALADVMDLYQALDLSTTSPVLAADVDRVVTGYVLQLLNENITITSLSSLQDEERYMTEDFPNWEEFKEWVQDVRQTVAMQRSRTRLVVESTHLDSVVAEVHALSDHLGAYQDIGCKHLKAGLVEIQHGSTGRVLLSDFYHTGLQGKHLFIEHTDFLRKLGALDESDIKHPSLIIANYIASQANCLASTRFHSVCCLDECEGLMGHLERSIAKPSASASRLAELVSHLRSDTVDAPRNLSASQMSRLNEIADHHQGSVPVHGRLFAQWMHHVYPLECPFPHAAGTTSPMSPDEWMEEAGVDEIMADEDFRKGFIRKDRPAPVGEETLPWFAVEELVVSHSNFNRKGGMLRKMAAFIAVMGVAVPVARAAISVVMPSQDQSEKIHCV